MKVNVNKTLDYLRLMLNDSRIIFSNAHQYGDVIRAGAVLEKPTKQEAGHWSMSYQHIISFELAIDLSNVVETTQEILKALPYKADAPLYRLRVNKTGPIPFFYIMVTYSNNLEFFDTRPRKINKTLADALIDEIKNGEILDILSEKYDAYITPDRYSHITLARMTF